MAGMPPGIPSGPVPKDGYRSMLTPEQKAQADSIVQKPGVKLAAQILQFPGVAFLVSCMTHLSGTPISSADLKKGAEAVEKYSDNVEKEEAGNKNNNTPRPHM